MWKVEGTKKEDPSSFQCTLSVTLQMCGSTKKKFATTTFLGAAWRCTGKCRRSRKCKNLCLTFPLFYFYFCNYFYYYLGLHRLGQISDLLHTGESQEDDDISDWCDFQRVRPQFLSRNNLKQEQINTWSLFSAMTHYWRPCHSLCHSSPLTHRVFQPHGDVSNVTVTVTGIFFNLKSNGSLVSLNIVHMHCTLYISCCTLYIIVHWTNIAHSTSHFEQVTWPQAADPTWSTFMTQLLIAIDRRHLLEGCPQGNAMR